MKRCLIWCLGFGVLVFGVCILVAQTNTVDVLPGDQKVADFFAKLSAWQFLLAPVVGALLQGVKKVLAMIPTKYFPVIGPIIGAILDYAATKAGLWTGNAVVGASMGALATWAHQLFTQLAPVRKP